MSILSRLIPAAVAAVALAAPAVAVTTYTFKLSPTAEVPPSTFSSGTGNGTLTLSSDDNTLTASGTFANLYGPSADGHLHCCAAPGADGPVAVPFTITTGATSGTISGVFNLLLATTYTAEFLQNFSSVAAARQGLLTGLSDGLGYVNVHSTQYPSGEIRGQVLAASGAVPEPGEWALMVAGFAMVGVTTRRRNMRPVLA